MTRLCASLNGKCFETYFSLVQNFHRVLYCKYINPSFFGNESSLAEKSVSSWSPCKTFSAYVGTFIHTSWITWPQMWACWDMLTKTSPYSPSQRLGQQIYFLTNARPHQLAQNDRSRNLDFLKKYINKKNLFIIPGLKLGNSCKTRDELSFSREESINGCQHSFLKFQYSGSCRDPYNYLPVKIT